ncbi:hypothetical protein [Streptomyces sp. NPDC051567]|uniref:hypothetical protein n=1 Tax=Streptomyces sp. NPDC051567 TaxID=3365660 RepID=UPI0037A7120C
MTRPLTRHHPLVRPRARPVAAAALLGPLLLTGCGITPTGVIGSGPAAHVEAGPPGAGALLYFLSPEGRAVAFPQDERLVLSPTALLVRLLAGPGPREREAGFTTGLPLLTGEEVLGRSSVEHTAEDALWARLPFAVRDLSEPARRQLVCSLSSTTGPDVDAQVTLVGTDTTLEPARCAPAR